ncbi:MAG: radical SAM family heme chaperone HemW [Anaerolineales bacterium]|nr:radical SAM family heme chaperone HemW [Anaerolineales bacterium]
MKTYALYVHIPFCSSRCSYCDFVTYTGQNARIPDYVQALVREISSLSRSLGSRLPISSVFFGGGTPSLLQPGQIREILTAVDQDLGELTGAEITLEANPESLKLTFLEGIRRAGVNRLSLGMQSAQPQLLKILDRNHSPEDVLSGVNRARRAGFANLSLDLIYGLPEQDLASWRATINQAISLQPNHLSLYSLTVERGTRISEHINQGLLSEPDVDQGAEMLELAERALAEAGFLQYEIANWAQPGFQSRHNLAYWRMMPYLGIGVAAHGFAAGVRTENVSDLNAYLDSLARGEAADAVFPRTPATARYREVDLDTEMDEVMIMGLRLTEEGVSRKSFHRRFNRDLETIYREPIRELLDTGLLEWAGERLRLTAKGRMLGNRVFSYFLR